MKKIIPVCIAFVVAVIVYKSLAKKEVAMEVKQGPIVVFGDSLAYGLGSTAGNSISEQLEKRLGVVTYNAGKPGDTTGSAKERLVSDVFVYNPGVVVVIVGGNDVLRRIPKEQTLANIRSIVTHIQQNGAAVVLVGVSTMVYNQSYQSIAKELHIPFVPQLLDKTMRDKNMMYDRVHPNDIGYALFVDHIEPEVRKLLGV